MDINAAIPVACTIGGSDSCGLAGVQADLKTFEAHRVFGTMALTCVTVQNPRQMYEVESLCPKLVAGQLKAVLSYFTVGALKTGLLRSCEVIEAVAQVLDECLAGPIVVDPVMVDSLGKLLVDKRVIYTYIERLISKAELVTPNLDEAAIFLGYKIENVSKMIEASYALRAHFGTAVLLKGGHLKSPNLIDIFVDCSGNQYVYEACFLKERNMRGSGCTLAAAIIANRARGLSLHEAISQAHAYLHRAIAKPIKLQGEGCIHHAVSEYGSECS